jgi:hypothetical protein
MRLRLLHHHPDRNPRNGRRSPAVAAHAASSLSAGARYCVRRSGVAGWIPALASHAPRLMGGHGYKRPMRSRHTCSIKDATGPGRKDHCGKKHHTEYPRQTGHFFYQPHRGMPHRT